MHRLTVDGIVAAVGKAEGMDILIHSFEKTVTNWIGHTLKADLFVAVKGVENASNQNKMSEETWKALANDPDVASAEVGHIIPINLKKAPTFLVGMRSTREWSTEQFIWIKPPKDRINKKQADENGYYAFESIWPGYYAGRPRHFHYKITTPSESELVTQCYFEVDPYINEEWEENHPG